MKTSRSCEEQTYTNIKLRSLIIIVLDNCKSKFTSAIKLRLQNYKYTTYNNVFRDSIKGTILQLSYSPQAIRRTDTLEK